MLGLTALHSLPLSRRERPGKRRRVALRREPFSALDTGFGKPNPLLLERVTTHYRPGKMVAVATTVHLQDDGAKRRMRFICVLSSETTRERIDELSEDEFPSLIVEDLGDPLT